MKTGTTGPTGITKKYGVAFGHLMAKRYEMARKAFEKDLKAEPKCHYTWHNLGAALFCLGKNREAIRAYDTSLLTGLSKGTGKWKTYHSRSLAWKEAGDFEKAFSDMDKAVKLRPNDPMLHSGRGQALLALHRYKEADEDFRRCEQLDKTNQPNQQS